MQRLRQTRRCTQRPENFRLDYAHPLSKGLVFAGLGNVPKGRRYGDSSVYGNHGTLTNMDPPSDWVYIPELGRWGLDFDGVDQRVPLIGTNTGVLNFGDGDPFTLAMWVLPATDARMDMFGKWGDTIQYCVSKAVTTNALVLYRTGGTRTLGGKMTPTVWSHVSVTINSAGIAYGYVNGRYVGTGGLRTITAQAVPANISRITNEIVGKCSDPLYYNRDLSLPEIQQLADPSNALLSGLILPPRRKWWPVVSAPATTKVPVFMNHYRNLRVSA